MPVTYSATIEYLYARLPMFTRIGAAAYKKDLHNTVALLEALGNPHHHFRSIHIAGTNGKGSTSHMLAAILHQCGYKTGLYTSPHLYDFRERIKVSGAGTNVLEVVPESFVVDFTQRIKPQIEAIEPSFFEVTVAMAFDYFAQQQIDIAVIETGLGGRLDSTNVIRPLVSVITNIGKDHMNLLGNTLAEIAYEKAGIIKKGVPVVIGASVPETKDVFLQKAAVEDAPIIWADNFFTQSNLHVLPETIEMDLYPTGAHATISISCDLTGLYQQQNIKTALATVFTLREQRWKIADEDLKTALKQVKAITGLAGRWQILKQHPMVIADVGHNEDGMKAILQQIEHLRDSRMIGQVHMVLGMGKDKSVADVLALLPPDFTYYFTQAQIPRALPAAELLTMGQALNLSGTHYGHVNDAVSHALSAALPNDLVIICGSIFVVAELDLPLIATSV